MKNDVFGKALSEYFYRGRAAPLLLHTSYGTTEDMPVDWFFRDEEDFPLLEQKALKLCRGKVLDIGAGVGSHALELQRKGLSVTALEVSPGATGIMSERGVRDARCISYQNFKGNSYDTILLLMNGIGVIGRLSALSHFLAQMRRLLNSGGQLIFDSSDIAYLYEEYPFPQDKYYGEISFCYEYRGQKGSWFHWLYVDQKTLLALAAHAGWQGKVLYEDSNQQYLVSLTPALQRNA